MPKTIDREDILKQLAERTPRSGQLWAKAQDLTPGGLLSNARRFEPYPYYTDHSQGAYIWDVDENRYIDCIMAFGATLLGSRPLVVMEALQAQLERGTVYGTPHPLEIAFAEKFLACVPCADRMLLCNSGTEATMQGARVMRAFTGRDRVAKFEGGFHGWHDYTAWSSAVYPDKMGPVDRPNAIPDSAGIPKAVEQTIMVLPLTDAAFDLIERHASELAGVMIEPVLGVGSIPIPKEFLEKLRQVTRKHGVLLMFDEVKTGFRMALGGAQEYHGIIPDVASYGKIIGGGLPIGALGVPKEIMDAVTRPGNSIMVAGTFTGNPMTLAAGNAMLGYLMEHPEVYTDLARKGDRLRDGFNGWAKEQGIPACINGVGSFFHSHLMAGPIDSPRQMINQPVELITDWQLLLRLGGITMPWYHDAFLSTAHSDEDVEEVIRVHKEASQGALAMHGLI